MSTPDNADQFWESRYHDAHTPWDRGKVSPALRGWLDTGVLTPGPILVPGCGNGYEVVALARRGFAVTAVDIAPTPLAALAQALRDAAATARLIHTDLMDWQPPRRFPAVYEQTCLCALTPDRWTDYAARLAQWLEPGGRLYACFMQTGGSGGPPFHCALDAMHGLFAAPTWRWPTEAPVKIPHPAGFHELAVILTRGPGRASGG